MSRTQATGSRPGSVSRALARDRLGVPAVLFFVLAGVAPLTVAAGVIPTAYATTGLTGIPAAFLVVAVILAIWASGYVAMTRHIRNAGTFYAFISAGLGRVTGVAAALVALLAYSFLQVGLYGAFGPNAAAEASAHLELHAAWWAWALAAWAVVTVLGLARIEPGGGFVEEQDARSHDEARGQVKPAAHAARILLDRLAAGVGQAELAEQLVSPAPRDICGQVVQAPEHHQVLAARENLIHGGVLPGEPDAGAHLGRLAGHVEPGDLSPPGIGAQQGRKHPDSGGLARPVRSQQAIDSAAPRPSHDRVL